MKYYVGDTVEVVDRNSHSFGKREKIYFTYPSYSGSGIRIVLGWFSDDQLKLYKRPLKNHFLSFIDFIKNIFR